jgi:CRP/FNR family transcriptional regulator
MKTIFQDNEKFICDINAPCFSNLTKEEIELVSQGKSQVIFRKGENLTKQGMLASYILFLISGVAKQFVESTNNKSLNIRISTPGEFIGLSSLFTKGHFDYSTISLTECQAYLIDRNLITSLIKTNGLFASSIIKRYCQDNSGLYKIIETIAYRQMNGKIARTLLYLDEIKKRYPRIFSTLTRKDIAEFSAVSPENAVKILKSLEKDNIIKIAEKNIEIIDPASLENIYRIG